MSVIFFWGGEGERDRERESDLPPPHNVTAKSWFRLHYMKEYWYECCPWLFRQLFAVCRSISFTLPLQLLALHTRMKELAQRPSFDRHTLLSGYDVFVCTIVSVVFCLFAPHFTTVPVPLGGPHSEKIESRRHKPIVRCVVTNWLKIHLEFHMIKGWSTNFVQNGQKLEKQNKNCQREHNPTF